MREVEQERTPNPRLKRQRELRGWSQARVAQELQTLFPGIAVTGKEVGRWESGKRKPGPYYREKLCVLFHTTADTLGFLPSDGAFEQQSEDEEPVHKEKRPALDWGEAPASMPLYGRDAELVNLCSWVGQEGGRVLALVGMGGIGKTSLAIACLRQVSPAFDVLFWRSLVNAPPARQVMQAALACFSSQPCTSFPDEMEELITRLIRTLQERRCILVLDNYETILQAGKQTGVYREGYEDYGRLVQRVGETEHPSCLLLTSREKPPEVAMLEGEGASTRSFHVMGVAPQFGQLILHDKGLQGAPREQEALILRYGGNPLALKLVSQLIGEVFNGAITQFLQEGDVIFRDIEDILDQQVRRLSPLEHCILYWLSIEREGTTLQHLHENLVQPVTRRALQEAVQSLRRRHLIEISASGMTLQNVVMDYLTERLISSVCHELQTGTLALCTSHALMQAQARDYVRESQVQVIVQPIVEHLRATIGHEASERLLKGLLAQVRAAESHASGYAAGNIVNLLIHAGCDLRGSDFSHLEIRQAYLQGAVLSDTTFACSRLLHCVFTETFGEILALACSPTGEYLAAGTVDGEICLWRISDGVPVLTLHGHTDWVYALSFSPDGNTLISGSDDRTIRLWDVHTGHTRTVLRGHTHWILTIALSPDGTTLVSSGEDRTLLVWDITTGQLLKTLHGHDARVWSVAFSPNGQLLASGSEDQSVRIWHRQTGQLITTLRGHTGAVWSVAFRPDGRILASGGEGSVLFLWETETWQPYKTLRNQGQGFWSLAFRPDGETLVCGGEDAFLSLWDVENEHLLNMLHGHRGRIRSVAWSWDGQVIVSGGEDLSVRLWESRTGHLHKTLLGYSSHIGALAFSPDGIHLVSGGEDGAVHLWQVERRHLVASVRGHRSRIWSVAMSPDGKTVVSGSNDCSVRLWDRQTQQQRLLLQGCRRWVLAVAFSPDGTIVAAGGGDRQVYLWDVHSGQMRTILPGQAGEIWSVAFHPERPMLASGGEDRQVCLWDVHSGQLLRTLQGHTGEVWSVAFRPDGRSVLSCGADQQIMLWSIETGQVLQRFQGHTAGVRSVAFSADGTMLVSGADDQTVRLWDVNSGRCLHVLQGHTDNVRCVAFHPAGTMVGSGSSDGTIKLWECQTGACVASLHHGRPYERMDITLVEGITSVQIRTLKRLGAMEQESLAAVSAGSSI